MGRAVNVNTADAGTLARELDGIGPPRRRPSSNIAEERAFRTADDLLKVQGIGQKVLDQNRANIRIEKTGQAPAWR